MTLFTEKTLKDIQNASIGDTWGFPIAPIKPEDWVVGTDYPFDKIVVKDITMTEEVRQALLLLNELSEGRYEPLF